MPANKNAVTRYYILDQLLANRYHNYSFEDLLEKVNEQLEELGQEAVSVRTIQYDVEYLEKTGLFLADIEHYQIDVPSKKKNSHRTVKKNCLRYADPTFSIFKKKLSDEESYLLSEALSLLGQFDGLPNLDALENLRKGLDIKSNRKIISIAKNPIGDTNRLGELFSAISQKQVVELHYHRFDSSEDIRQVIVSPYLLKEYNRRWYMIAAAEDTGKILNFALDRIDKVVPLPSHIYMECGHDLSERFEDIIGVTLIEENTLQEIIFWVSDISKSYILTKPLHESQRPVRGDREQKLRTLYPTLQGGAFFAIECIENYELIRELSLFGKDLLVMSPSDIQQKVFQRAKEMCEQYSLLRK